MERENRAEVKDGKKVVGHLTSGDAVWDTDLMRLLVADADALVVPPSAEDIVRRLATTRTGWEPVSVIADARDWVARNPAPAREAE